MESSVVSDIIDTASSEFFLKREANITVLAADGADAEITSETRSAPFMPATHRSSREMRGDAISLRKATRRTFLFQNAEREVILDR